MLGKKIIPKKQGLIQRGKIFSLLTNRSNIHIVIIILCLLVVTNNIKAQDQDQSVLSQRKTIIAALTQPEDEEIIEEGLLPPVEEVVEEITTLVPEAEQITEETEIEEMPSSIITEEGGAIVQPSIVSTSPIPRTGTVEYTVQEGDTLGDIAVKFGISLNTLLWENKLGSRSMIKPGQKLTILPVTGLGYKIKSGDTLDKIAKTYKSDVEKIIEINELASATDIQVGQTIVIPDGQMPQPVYQPSSAVGYVKNIFTGPTSTYGGHKFPWGQCTWYVAQKRYVPWGGHAKNWIANARAYGYKIGSAPVPGAIIVTRESWYGHVGYVESVSANTVTFSETNYQGGLGVVTRRTLKQNDYRIIGYIY